MTSPLSDDFDQNYDQFIAEAIDLGCVWALEGEEGFALCPSVENEEIDVMPLWSQPEYAQAHCKEEWSVYKPVPIALEELLDEWLPGMHSDVVFVGVNWDENMEGVELEPLDLLEEIDREAAS
ncbi:DUF2750 domain-containing protein [Agaribacterium sp. ZY112]|uniref:DUF2750 domain-containing protein n=1 Tax=Agaribacterium sp. ZY112 TaxID=3233574 RepID=UPI0035265213